MKLSVKVKEVLKRLKKDGWYQVRMRGSHRILAHPQKSGIVVVPGKLSDDIPVGTLGAIWKTCTVRRLSMKQYAVIYEKGDTNWGAIVPDLPGCVSIGNTLEEVQENIKEAISKRSASRCALYLEVLKERGEKIPQPETHVGFVEIAA